MNMSNSRRGQVWVETVIYTLIGIALIGLVLAILTPKIKEFRDRSVIEQTIDSLNVFDSKVVDVLNNTIRYVLDESNVRYSEPGVSLDIGRINVTTQELTESYRISLYMSYKYNITFNGKDSNSEQFTPVSIPYEFFIENKGMINNNVWIDVTEGS